MSKLKFLASLFFISAFFVGAFYWQRTASHVETNNFSHLFSEETRLWGKAMGPIQVRLEFKKQSDNQVTLVGHVRSTRPKFEIQWKLPEGVRLVEGVLSETVQQSNDSQVVHEREITVEVDWPLTTPHLVLRAVDNDHADALGATTVFNLDPSMEDLEKQDIIRAHMKSRHVQKMVK